MDEKTAATGHQTPEILSNNSWVNMPNPRLSSSRKFLIGLLSLVLPFYVIISLLSDAFSATQQIDSSPAESSLSVKSRNRSLVPLEAHIMSKCPDARDCLQDLVVPAMEQVVDKVDFTLSFIGS